MQPGPRDQKILPEMHEMPVHRKEMVMALPSDSEGESEEELEYSGRGTTLEDWEELHKQQIQFAQYQFDKKVKALQNLQNKYKMLEDKLKKAKEETALVAGNATRQALQLV